MTLRDCKMTRGLTFCFLLFHLVLLPAAKPIAPCFVEFPTVDMASIDVEENGTLDLSFQLSEPWCTQSHFYDISIRKRYRIICTIRISGEQCHTFPPCSCTDNENFTLKKKVTRKDHGDWRWQIDNSTTDTATIYVNVKYPAKVTALTLQNPEQPAAQDDQVYLANPGDRLQVKCSVEDGNPPVTARLLDRHGTELQTQKNDRKPGTTKLKYEFHSVMCHHAGLITCQGGESKTVTLLVKCPPTSGVQGPITFPITSGDGADLSFNITAHSSHLHNCSIVKLGSTEPARNCSSLAVTGTPPDLTVRVRLDNVTEHDDLGSWRLSLTNDAGAGHVDFHLTLPEIDVEICADLSSTTSVCSGDMKLKTSSTASMDPLLIWICCVMLVVLAVGVIARCVIIACTKTASQHGGGQVERQAAVPDATGGQPAIWTPHIVKYKADVSLVSSQTPTTKPGKDAVITMQSTEQTTKYC